MAARRGAASVVAHRGWTALLVAVLMLTGCTYSRSEPGLFPPAPPSAPPSAPAWTPRPPNPKLPVLGAAIWTTGEGLNVTVRFALQAVRRIPGATVLDWSVTPLSAPGRALGDVLPSGVDLGLSRAGEGDVNVLLLDPARGKAYRPLSHKQYDVFNHCLCTPLWVAQLVNLRMGETRLLQTAYPQLPGTLRYVDVAMMNSLPFLHVPVTGIGLVPYAGSPTDVTCPGHTPGAWSRRLVFNTRQTGLQRTEAISILAVQRAATYTSMQWGLDSLGKPSSFWSMPDGSPVSTSLPDSVPVLDPVSASGPKLRPSRGGAILKTRWLFASGRGGTYYECLCSDLGLWAASLRTPGGRATVVTTFPALPAGVTAVDVILPGVGTIRQVPVTTGPDSAARQGPVLRTRSASWTYSTSDPPPGWTADAWPTPLPDTAQLHNYRSLVQDITSPGW